MVRCNIGGCKPSLGASSHSIPKHWSEEKVSFLLRALKFKKNYIRPSRFKVCSDHFACSSFVKTGRGHGESGLQLSDHWKLVNENLKEISLTESEAYQASVDAKNNKLFARELKSRYRNMLSDLELWIVKEVDNGLIFHDITYYEDEAKIEKSVLVSKVNEKRAGLQVSVILNGTKVDRTTVYLWSELDALLTSVIAGDVEQNPRCIIEGCMEKLRSIKIDNSYLSRALLLVICQLSNIVSMGNRFCPETILMATLLRNISPAAYDALGQFLVFPTKRHLSRLSENFDPLNTPKFLSIAAAKCKSPLEKLVTVQVDELALKDEIIYKNGMTHGFEERPDGTQTDKVAKRGVAFYMSSIFGQMKELVKLMPITKQSSEELAQVLLNTIAMIQTAGFTVVVVITDAAAVNKGMFKALTGDAGSKLNCFFLNPSNPLLRIFVKFDTVHLFKNIRNNWISTKDQMKSFLVPVWQSFSENFNRPADFILVDDPDPIDFCFASFKVIRKHFDSFIMNLLKPCFRLSYKCLYLSGFDRQKVQYVEPYFMKPPSPH